METARTRTARKTSPADATKTTTKRAPRVSKTAPKGATAKTTGATKTSPKGSAKTAPKSAPRVASGPTPDRAKLAATVAKLRAKGAKWNEIAAETGKSEPTLAKLRSDVRAGKFAKISPVAARVPADAF